MNCDTLQRRLLALEQLDCPGDDLRHHLTLCSACQEWYDRALQIERDAAHLVVPAPIGLSSFLAEFLPASPGRAGREAALATSESPASPATVLTPEETRPSRQKPHPSPVSSGPPILRFDPSRRGVTSPRERALRKMAVAVALAASLLVVTFGILAWQRGNTAGPERTRPDTPTVSLTPLEQRLKGDDRWGSARTPRERVRVLGAIAHEVQRAAQVLARKHALEDVEKEVTLFREVIRRITATEAPQLANSERETVLRPIVHRLQQVESEVNRLAVETADAAPPLRELASAAREGARELRILLGERA